MQFQCGIGPATYNYMNIGFQFPFQQYIDTRVFFIPICTFTVAPAPGAAAFISHSHVIVLWPYSNYLLREWTLCK